MSKPPPRRKGGRRTAAPASGSDGAPEGGSAEQDDESAQAQSVAEQALHPTALGLGDTVKMPTGGEGDDWQDLVDHMRQMDSSGVIDMSAYAGERNDDEEEGRYGAGGEDD